MVSSCARVEGRAFGGALDFDVIPAAGHDDVHVDFGLGVFEIAQVEHGHAFDDADADGGEEIVDQAGADLVLFAQFLKRQAQGHEGAGDGGGAGAAVGLDDVAVENHGALAEFVHAEDGAQGAPDEALDFLAASADFAAHSRRG